MHKAKRPLELHTVKPSTWLNDSCENLADLGSPSHDPHQAIVMHLPDHKKFGKASMESEFHVKNGTFNILPILLGHQQQSQIEKE